MCPRHLVEALARSYGSWIGRSLVSARRVAAAGLIGVMICGFFAAAFPSVASADATVKIVALGDSLTAGYGLPGSAAFPARLERALKAKGYAVEIVNAGVSGDTASGGLARLDWSVPAGTHAVVLELGANDALRGIDPKVTRKALTAIVARLKARNIEILLCGMQAPPNLGAAYAQDFNAVFTDLADGLIFYPFFLDGIAADRTLNQRDGVHPTSAGVDAIVKGILPKAEELIRRVQSKQGA